MKRKHWWFEEPRAIELHWQDAQSIMDGWRSSEELNDWAAKEYLALIRTIGYLVGHSEHYWIINCCNQNRGDYHSHCQRIPKGCVTFFRWLKPEKWQKAGKLEPLKLRKVK